MKKSFQNRTFAALLFFALCQFCFAQINTTRIQTTIQPSIQTSSLVLQALQAPSAWVARHNWLQLQTQSRD